MQVLVKREEPDEESPLERGGGATGPMVRWPRKDASNVTAAFQFVEVYGKHVAVILDCFEVSTQRSANLGGEEHPLSESKPNKTAKYLIIIIYYTTGLYCIVF